jgi:uncharacterized iron-regulated membrane protein
MLESVDAIDGAIIRAGMVSIVMFIGCFAMCLAAISITICRGKRRRRQRRHRTPNIVQNHESARDIAANACDIAIARLQDKNEVSIV